MLSGAALSSAVAILAFASHADAHGALKVPEPTFEQGASHANWVTLVDNYWDIGSGGDQVGKFKTMAAEKGMSVKDVILDMVKDKKCGFTRADADPQPVSSDGKLVWRGSGNNGFTHTGPCEVYIDDKLVLHGDNCEDEYPGGPDESGKLSEMTIDYSSCNGDCMLSFYWLGFQNEQWQSYVNCIPLTGSGKSTGTQPSGNQATEAPSLDEKPDEKPNEERESLEERSSDALSMGNTKMSLHEEALSIWFEEHSTKKQWRVDDLGVEEYEGVNKIDLGSPKEYMKWFRRVFDADLEESSGMHRDVSPQVDGSLQLQIEFPVQTPDSSCAETMPWRICVCTAQKWT
ncbi:hypothetical protein BBP00_00009754 [Phytophthora kernoviae]|uniref:Uncharacterized protein n=1 Tax=Phytophthora kernoviae TaxID=325452 RepID=A0A3F2RDN3_9STRA|nr:hypothetical protein BBP00_00009754 [Phytophthora kernoviae]